ncbi:MAG: prepilin-type N-terminal cleavage/methylation domain-containing protein [Rubrivivax sp.]|nr:prepilin-type N-terminal cleavage/methylation domain-containing protein [Rubrivivax sp.]
MTTLPVRRSSHRGFSLIEVMVSTVLVLVGLLGVVTLQTRAVQLSVSAEDQLRASLLANELAAQMWTARTVSLPTTVTDAWATRAADAAGAGLPNALATVTVAGNTARITVAWRPVNAPASQARHRFVTDVTLP